MSLAGEERKQTILDMLQLQGKVRTPELVARLDVSSETVRRYLEELEMEKKLKRVYGGAVKINVEREEPAYVQREVLQAEEKKRIGRAAASLIQDQDVIVIDDGTTTLQMIDSLVLRKQLTVLVTSVHTLNLLMGYKNRGVFDGELVLIGGRVNTKHYRTSGSLAMHFMNNFYVDKAFIVADGLQIDTGVTAYEDERAMLSRMFMKQAKQSIVLADHTKIGTTHYCKIADLEEMDIVISDIAPPREWQARLQEKDIHWLIAE
ncbi:DeoR/GlpR family transcriptional regulator of sugar metabolism [Paenibacillus phyllosphaerae]|uniref:DeoR/GlpR family transcriptional regulator of sugar metabolism n=1 Tax=Paenibacillus phyllosphaerae TaxID=274593 RepID=A0A7W5AXP8_9BACL|nr:DeoR/GlpR family DNA-binding transcription regulator [Paenibacillus phyllosphaerae]MBB3110685.1 DeoR/GlpR family transcriptional regulator of sugar metabolism [Paenibacillus phyllosphaerae]